MPWFMYKDNEPSIYLSIIKLDLMLNKFALLWGEAQKKIAYSYLKVT